MNAIRQFLLGLLITVAGAVVSIAPAAAGAGNAPLLWRIDGKTPVYLFGTIHIPDPRVTELHPLAEQAFVDSEVLLTELTMTAETMAAAAQAMLLPDSQSLAAQLSPAQQQLLATELRAISRQLKPALYDRLKPWAVAVQLQLLPVQLKHPGVPALDQQLAERAGQAGKRNEGLEQLQEQLAIFDALSQPEQLALLQETLEVMAKARQSGTTIVERLTVAYLSGDEAKVDALLTEFQGDNTELNARLTKALFDDRNQTMTTRLLAKLQAEPTTRFFVAVGAAHLIGDKSIVALLRQRGYTVTRIR